MPLPDEAELRIVIPACNEEARIAATLHDYCSQFRESARIVVVANGCTDSTVAVVEELKRAYSNIFVVDIQTRIGKGGAVRVGFSAGPEKVVGFVDADGSTSAAQFGRLVSALAETGLDGVIGSRWSRGSIVENRQTPLRRVASRVFNAMVRVFFGLTFRDTQCGAKVFRRTAIEKVLAHLEISNFAFDVDLLLQLKRAGLKVVEVPIRWADEALRSQVQLVPASFSMFAAILRLRLRDSAIARIPFFDYLGRRSLIPARERLSLLVLSDHFDSEPEDEAFAFTQDYVAKWQDSGHSVAWIRMSGTAILSRLRVFMWYALFGRHEYDAVLEIPSRVPFFIPAWSVKPRFLITGGRRASRTAANRTYETFYKRVPDFNVTAAERTNDTYEELLQLVKLNREYGTVFEKEGSDWALRFNDVASGTSRRQPL